VSHARAAIAGALAAGVLLTLATDRAEEPRSIIITVIIVGLLVAPELLDRYRRD